MPAGLMKSCEGAPSMSKGRSRKHNLLLGVIAVITLLQLSFWYQIGSNGVQDLDDCTGGAMSSPHCAEAEIFRQWRAASRNASQIVSHMEQLPVADSDTDSEAILHALFTSTADPEGLLNGIMQSTGLNMSSEQVDVSLTSANHADEKESIDVRVEGHVQSFEESEPSSEQQAVAWARKRSDQATFETSEHAVAWARKRLVTLQELAHSDTNSEAILHAQSNSTAGRAGLVNDTMQSTGLNMSSEQVNVSLTSANHADEKESIDVRVEGHVQSFDESEPSSEQRAIAWARKRKVTLQSSEQAVAWARKRLATLQEHLETPKVEHTPEASAPVPQGRLEQMFDFGRDLCSQPSRRNHWACANFWKTQHDHAVSPSENDDSEDPFTARLSWLDVESWESKRVSRSLRGSTAPLVVSRQQLKHVSWLGSLPRVACVALLPSGRDADAQMEYFVQAFMRQDYEGPKQLIIVYHHHDSHAQAVVEKHEDGVNVLGVRAMGADEDLSTTAYRYGAWSADADVIMRYDFGAWHHAARISMQVRALAVAKRPASRLLRWTARDYGQGGVAQAPPDSQVQALGEASLTGDKRWMAKHWFPLMTGERERLLDAGQFVTNVDMAQLLVYNAAV